MDQETKKEFEELTLIVRDSFGALEERMDGEFKAVRAEMDDGFKAVRAEMDDGFKAVRAEMDDGFKAVRAEMNTEFASIRVELSEIKVTIQGLEERVERLFKTETEDVSAFYRDFTELKRRVEKIEKFVQLQVA
ncbi:MAG: hypothetical protein HY981_03065 [Candidatus Magasanikbacteria bacterium]|nr:hypothetical protein [Candidatus Magasanikbacteria bacterium]